MSGSLFFLFFFPPGNETSFLFNCTKFTLQRVRATIQSVGDLGLWGLNASSEQLLGPCSPEPTWLAEHSPQVGKYKWFLSLGGQQTRVGVSFSVHLCSASLRKGMLGTPPKPAAVSSPELAAWNCAFRGVLPSSVWMGWLCRALSFWLQSPC